MGRFNRADALIELGLLAEADRYDAAKVQAAYVDHRGSGGQVAGPRPVSAALGRLVDSREPGGSVGEPVSTEGPMPRTRPGGEQGQQVASS